MKLVIVCALLRLAVGNIDEDTVPEWSSVYSVKGILYLPYAEISEPLDAWYDGGQGKSRIDYYHGMVKTYQLTGRAYEPFGTMIKIAPVTTETQLNVETCLQVNGTLDYQQSVQSVLPNMTDFKYIGPDKDSVTHQWQMVDTNGGKFSKYTMWIKYREEKCGNIIPIPVRYEMKGRNTLLGAHYDHYYINYSDFCVDEIDADVFQVRGLECSFLPGSGPSQLQASFNPMKEFMHPTHEDHVETEFTRFKSKHNKEYENDNEYAKRMHIFRQNLRFVHSKNRANLGFSMSMNHLSDRTDEEMAALRGRRYTPLQYRRSGEDTSGLPFPYTKSMVQRMCAKLPSHFDWRLCGAVTPVKDQSVCGSCWSFSAVGAVEGALFLRNGGHLVRLSQQALVDCSWGFGNNGCDGGEDYRAYQWIMKHGLPTEEDYGGYLGQDGYCHIDNVTTTTSVRGWVKVPENDEMAFKLALFKNGPISVSIDASHKTFTFYNNGIYYQPECKRKVGELDHAVLVVGYAELMGVKYWLVKNSWSNLWGNDGYIFMAIEGNNCGVESAATYVVI